MLGAFGKWKLFFSRERMLVAREYARAAFLDAVRDYGSTIVARNGPL